MILPGIKAAKYREKFAKIIKQHATLAANVINRVVESVPCSFYFVGNSRVTRQTQICSGGALPARMTGCSLLKISNKSHLIISMSLME